MVLAPGTALAAVLALIVTVAVVSSGPAGRSEDAGSGGGGAAAGGGAESQTAAPSAADEVAPMPNAATAPAPPPAAGRAGAGSDGRDRRFVERSAALTLAARPADIDRTAADVVEVTERLGGFVASQSVTSSADGGGGDLLLRVPSARLAEALSQLGRVAAVRERSQNAQDITAERVSAAERLRTAQAYRRSLLRRLAAATTETEAQQLRSRLTRVNRRIAGFRTRLSRVDNRARYANVGVTLVADRRAGGAASPDEGRWSPGDAAKDALRVLEVAAGVLLVALAVALPLLVVAALLSAARRLALRRSRHRVLDAV
jgi:hypothetical protein